MGNRQGDFIWYELMTPDIEGARSFYKAVAGMEIGEKSDMPGMDYRMISHGDHQVGGALSLTEEMTAAGTRPVWVAYICVNDVDASTEAVRAAGGSVWIEPTDIPGVGRYAMVADPQGATFYLMRGAVEGGESTVWKAMDVGHWAWNELWAKDVPGAVAFYTALFGWTQQGGMPMGERGDYLFVQSGEDGIGAIGPKKDPSTPAFWQHYFRVGSISAAVKAIEANGGTLVDGPHEVPGGDHVIEGKDPQGATFALVGGA